MSRDSKRFKEAKSAVEVGRIYTPLEAAKLLKSFETANFDETVEVHIKLGVNPRHADQQVRGTVMLPHGTGKTIRVAVFAKGEKATEAEAAGGAPVGAAVRARSSAPTLSALKTWLLLSKAACSTSTPPWPLPI
jgi:large subunit ribosomal protein L1